MQKGLTYPERMPLAPTPLQRFLRTRTGRRLASALVRRTKATLHGAENIPREGGALLVGNHAILGVDAVPLTALLALHTGRTPRFLGERVLWKIPLLRLLLRPLGIVRGEPEAAVRLLEAGELVCVYPGGVLDSYKPSSQAYTLQWGSRAGFARVAMRAKVPIVPIAGTGVDEIYEVRRREHFLGRRLFGSERYDLPIPRHLWPRIVPLDYYALAQVDTRGDVDRAEDVERVRRATYEAIDAVLGAYRESRASPVSDSR